ncbi:hypothetical protein KXW18_001849 [Aspergillus fumigatus]|nr:hypothetical protein KXW88_002511 [Aspergillus fumigatus]KAH2320631.1 hypothetical protein KXV47_000167 [Aspergillus fumigatus]KAH3141599.1 hypothetical protein KXW18_001849 [Aspergillus fumigatus]
MPGPIIDSQGNARRLLETRSGRGAIQPEDREDADTTDACPVRSREGALAAAQKVPLSLTKPQEPLVILMAPARSLEWISRNGVDQKNDVKNENHQNTVLLYTRGVEPDEPCKSCANGTGTFRHCIAAPASS